MVRRIAQRQFNMRLNSDDSRRFQKVADKYALSITGVIRMLMKREFDSIVEAEKAAQRR
jgi:antitoxin component of RelBE/YafQ-DinJ toxin-antitoxin module